jgi:thioredoxin-related protein
VDVYTDWCGWCKRMDRDVYARDDMRTYLNQRFILVKLSAESADGRATEQDAHVARAGPTVPRDGYPPRSS